MALVFGMMVVGCDDGTTDDDGGNGGGGGNITITISGLTDGTTYYVGPAWEVGGGLSASGYNIKSAVASGGKVTVIYSTGDISNVVGELCNIAFKTDDFIILGEISKGTYTMGAGKVIDLTYPDDFN
jgi:hypothetical protein